jgi:hypothetical protein
MNPIGTQRRPGFGRTGLLALSVTASALLGPGSPARAADLAQKSDKFVPRHSAAQSKGWSSVIVRFTAKLTDAQQRQLKALGADIYRHLDFIQSAAMRIPNRSLDRLAALPYVQHISADLDVKKSDRLP